MSEYDDGYNEGYATAAEQTVRDQRIEELENAIAPLLEQLDRRDKRIEALEQQLANNRKHLHEANERIRELESAISSYVTSLNNVLYHGSEFTPPEKMVER